MTPKQEAELLLIDAALDDATSDEMVSAKATWMRARAATRRRIASELLSTQSIEFDANGKRVDIAPQTPPPTWIAALQHADKLLADAMRETHGAFGIDTFERALKYFGLSADMSYSTICAALDAREKAGVFGPRYMP